MSFSSALSLLALFLPTVIAKYPNPEPCSGVCQVHDPSVARGHDGTYYLYGSAPGVSMKTAPSLNGPWSNTVEVFDTTEQLGAPDVQLVKDTWWLYYQRTTIGTQQSNISVASTKDLSQPFQDHGIIDIPPQSPAANYNRIDPNLLVLDDGKTLYLSFGSFWEDIFQLRLLDPTTIDTGSLKHLEENVTAPNFRQTSNTGANPSEGSYQFFWQDSYYLFWSSGNCCHNSSIVPLGDEYKIMVCKADAATGPFFDKAGKNCVTQNGGTEILATHDNVYAPGGQGVRYDEELQSVVLYYHWLRFDNQSAPATFGWNYLAFDEGGWPYVTTKSSNSTHTHSSSVSSSSSSSSRSSVSTTRPTSYPSSLSTQSASKGVWTEWQTSKMRGFSTATATATATGQSHKPGQCHAGY